MSEKSRALLSEVPRSFHNFALLVSPGVGTGVGVGEAARVEHD